MIELLKSGKINNRLLCEMAAHERFSRFMADMEIYGDGIASMQIQNLNSVVDMARIEIEERCHELRIDYDGLSEEEFAVMIKVLRKSEKLKSAARQRGRQKKEIITGGIVRFTLNWQCTMKSVTPDIPYSSVIMHKAGGFSADLEDFSVLLTTNVHLHNSEDLRKSYV